ncbi:TLC domain-containing protein 5-like [Hemicordylus capensis]|uniref:TLC domain-containing protein 5-like n=1 Tax=Hemicordylus capensis TaxID=884348 RepID=UPI002303EFD2|nr:TLC domain-containing protein 5-like [Hemicordylus capensis]
MVSIAVQVVFSLLVWLSLYSGFWCRNKHRTAEWSCRLVTLMHGLIVTFLSGYIVLIDGPWPLTHAGSPNTALQVCLMCLTLGYFIFDLSWCLYFNSEGELMICHHALSICGMVIVLVLGVSATEINAVIFVSEITNPLLQARWFLREMGRYHNSLGDVVDFLFVTLFLGMRIVGGAWIVHSVVISPKTIWILKGGVLAMYLVSLGFLLNVLGFARRKMWKKYFAWKTEGTGGELPKSNGHLPAC